MKRLSLHWNGTKIHLLDWGISLLMVLLPSCPAGSFTGNDDKIECFANWQQSQDTAQRGRKPFIDSFIMIQKRWKCVLTWIHILILKFATSFAHDLTAVPMWHVQNFVVINYPGLRWLRNEVCIKFLKANENMWTWSHNMHATETRSFQCLNAKEM